MVRGLLRFSPEFLLRNRRANERARKHKKPETEPSPVASTIPRLFTALFGRE